MTISERQSQLEQIFWLTGFALAHAVWNVSDGELLCTLAFTENSETLEQIRFEADTIGESIDLARNHLAKIQWGLERWVLIFDGYITTVDERQERLDALITQIWCRDIELPARIGQPYRPATSSDGFRLIGEPSYIDYPDSLPELEIVQNWVREGIQSHAEAATQWAKWAKGER